MKCAVYSSNRRTRHWPMAVFYQMSSDYKIQVYQGIGRESYQASTDVKDTVQKIMGNNEAAVRPQVPDDKMEKRKTCAFCPSVKERKTAYKCTRCSKPVCLEWRNGVGRCKDCAIKCLQ
ncbi:hypothetical protein J6590_055771 [Homalodisca vitripennis]|nr:hypothetical protein J6590_055771 [Homalodisca vitripennis]